MPIPGFGRSPLPPSLRSERERLEEARRTGLDEHADMMYRPGTAGFPTPLPSDEDRMRFENIVPSPDVLEAGISSMRTFESGMGDILGNLSDKFGLYQLAILGVADAWGQFIAGQESFGSAMRKAAASSIAALSKEAAVLSMIHAAQGVAALFSPWALAKYGPSATNFKAAALFAAAAGASGAAARAVGGIGGSRRAGEPVQSDLHAGGRRRHDGSERGPHHRVSGRAGGRAESATRPHEDAARRSGDDGRGEAGRGSRGRRARHGGHGATVRLDARRGDGSMTTDNTS
jgi:hypothetical protein